MDSLKSALPVVIIIIALCFTIAPIPNGTFLAFLFGAALLIVGIGLFNLGAQTAMIPIGEHIGAHITKTRRLWFLIVMALLIGIFITVAEPDLQVLAGQIPAVPNAVLVISVAVGVGLFLVVALLRMLFYIPISRILIVCYAAVFGLAAFVSHDFWAVAFDAGGVTTGPMTVPFIMSIGMGVASIRSDKHASNDSFGLVALSSVGPILTVMILGLLYNPTESSYATLMPAVTANSRELGQQFMDASIGFPHYFKEILLAFAPVVVFFLMFQIFGLHLKKRQFLKIVIGLVYTFLGLVLFLTGVNIGFMPAGYYLGGLLSTLPYNWVLIPIAMLIGYFLVTAEPAVHVLNKQVEEISSGAIPAKAMRVSLSIGMCVSLGLSMVRLLTGISIMWFLVPGYAIALTLTFFVPKIFTAIAFDSGGVASGPMTATFLLPLAIGVCNQLGGTIMTDAFGVVAMVAMTPLITIQIMGFAYKVRLKPALSAQGEELAERADTDIIE
ncbi:MAG: DUF1538 domain-containing protein [Oscillospiraceae bacterium]|nr:DUF1538 domain-containing protein [Oscillospiraceae bacterium]